MLAILTLTLALVLLGCGTPEDPGGFSTTEVCEELTAALAGERPGDSLAERNRDTAERLLAVALLAQGAADPELAALGGRLESHARSVLDRLEPDATDEQARLIAEPMLRESIRLHSGCLGHLSDPDHS